MTSRGCNLAVINGFRVDCQDLMDKFDNISSTKYKDFINLWKEMKFSSVFSWCSSMLETLQFCNEALHIAKEHLIYGKDLKQKVAALYILYTIYYKFFNHHLKIRITMSNWQTFTELHSEIKNDMYRDANFVLSKMIVAEAFHFTLLEYERKPCEAIKYFSLFNPYSILPKLKDFTREGSAMTKVHQLGLIYEEEKAMMLGDGSSKSVPQLFDTNLKKNIEAKIKKFEVERYQLFAKKFLTKPSVSQPLSTPTKRNYKLKTRAKKKYYANVGDAFKMSSSESEHESVSEMEEEEEEEEEDEAMREGNISSESVEEEASMSTDVMDSINVNLD